ncbi:hypothetical protein J2S74_002286 [Evansella vedderi]|uniref:Uncharacterized protein n=1 Tax=Evansella vedderi TaxID=38282 RepID=A0ABT9ZVK9_9BACI|nr:hypothetical protein [Evansella vedderi]MDQ0254904.1 hypothetical protein [Evansella vedderi]
MKVGIYVEQKVVFRSDVIVEQPESMSDRVFESIIGKVERFNEDIRDFTQILESEHGIKVLKVSSGFPDSPDTSEIEIIDVRNIKEDQ